MGPLATGLTTPCISPAQKPWGLASCRGLVGIAGRTRRAPRTSLGPSWDCLGPSCAILWLSWQREGIPPGELRRDHPSWGILGPSRARMAGVASHNVCREFGIPSGPDNNDIPGLSWTSSYLWPDGGHVDIVVPILALVDRFLGSKSLPQSFQN